MECPSEELIAAYEAGTPETEILELICCQLRRFGVTVDRSGWAGLAIGEKAKRVRAALDAAEPRRKAN